MANTLVYITIIIFNKLIMVSSKPKNSASSSSTSTTSSNSSTSSKSGGVKKAKTCVNPKQKIMDITLNDLLSSNNTSYNDITDITQTGIHVFNYENTISNLENDIKKMKMRAKKIYQNIHNSIQQVVDKKDIHINHVKIKEDQLKFEKKIDQVRMTINEITFVDDFQYEGDRVDTTNNVSTNTVSTNTTTQSTSTDNEIKVKEETE